MGNEEAVVRVRLSGEQVLRVGLHRQVATRQRVAGPAVTASSQAPPAASMPVVGALAHRPVIALIEAVPVAADDLAAAVMRVVEAGGHRCGAISLDGQNRLAAKLGNPARQPAWCWKQTAPELILWQGARAIVSGPSAEDEIETAEYAAVLNRVCRELDCTVIDLGCRWAPRLFRAVLPLATHIWVVTRPGQWSGVEMRLEQAEYSGWTDMRRVRVLQIGSSSIPSLTLAVPIAGALPDLTPERVREFVLREVGRSHT